MERSKKRTMVMPRPRDPERQINQHLRTVHGARPLIIASPPGEEGAHKGDTLLPFLAACRGDKSPPTRIGNAVRFLLKTCFVSQDGRTQ